MPLSAGRLPRGRFQSVSEAVRTGLPRLDEDELKLEALRAKLAAGDAGPLVEDFSPRAFLADVCAKHGR